MNQSTSIDENHDHDQNPMSRLFFEQQNHHSPSLQLIDCYNYNFNPFLDHDHLHQDFILGHILYSKKHQLLGNNYNPNFFYPEIGLVESTNNETTQNKAKNDDDDDDHPASPKKPIISRSKKSSSGGMKKKDRHSKICTSKGPRDRRMRLSLEIARNFFDLQDMLGFDKASKTVEWLFTKSTSAIKELKEKYLSSEACCDDSSLVTKFSLYNDNNNKELVGSGKKRRRPLRIVDKESRYKARARARERTRAKSIRRGLEISKTNFEGNPDKVCKMGDVIEEISSSKRKMTHVSVCENQKILEPKGKNLAFLNGIQCEDKRVSKEIRCDEIQHLLPDSSLDMATLSLDTMKASPPGLKLVELDEIDGVLIFYGE